MRRHIKQIWEAFCSADDNSDIHPKDSPVQPKQPERTYERIQRKNEQYAAAQAHQALDNAQQQQRQAMGTQNNPYVAVGAAIGSTYGRGASFDRLSGMLPRVVLDSSAVSQEDSEIARRYYERHPGKFIGS